MRQVYYNPEYYKNRMEQAYNVPIFTDGTPINESCGNQYTYPVSKGASCNSGDYKLPDGESCNALLKAAADKGQGEWGWYENQCNKQ
jgi:hypothetical protein